MAWRDIKNQVCSAHVHLLAFVVVPEVLLRFSRRGAGRMTRTRKQGRRLQLAAIECQSRPRPRVRAVVVVSVCAAAGAVDKCLTGNSKRCLMEI